MPYVIYNLHFRRDCYNVREEVFLKNFDLKSINRKENMH